MSKVKKTKEELKCGICLSPFSYPITLLCQDTFCKECLISMKDRKCPVCRLPFLIPKEYNRKLHNLALIHCPEELAEKQVNNNNSPIEPIPAGFMTTDEFNKQFFNQLMGAKLEEFTKKTRSVLQSAAEHPIIQALATMRYLAFATSTLLVFNVLVSTFSYQSAGYFLAVVNLSCAILYSLFAQLASTNEHPTEINTYFCRNRRNNEPNRMEGDLFGWNNLPTLPHTNRHAPAQQPPHNDLPDFTNLWNINDQLANPPANTAFQEILSILSQPRSNNNSQQTNTNNNHQQSPNDDQQQNNDSTENNASNNEQPNQPDVRVSNYVYTIPVSDEQFQELLRNID